MDLSFARSPLPIPGVLPTDLAVLLGRAAARQAASTTARVAGHMVRIAVARRLLAPADGAFHAPTAALLRATPEVKRVFT